MTATTQPSFHVLLPVHNRRAVTEGFVRCLISQTYVNWHLVLIDDGSRDGTADAIQDLVPSVTVLRGAGNWWWGGSLHQGYLWLKRQPNIWDDIVLIINDDTEIEPDFLANAVARLRPHSLLLAQLYSLSTGAFVEAGAHIDWRTLAIAGTRDPCVVNCQSTRGLFLRARDFLEVGGFHPILLPHYLSDYEFTMRARSKGFVLASDPSVRLFYNEHSTGIHVLGDLPILRRVRVIFSKRFTNNPLYWTVFVLMRCPIRHVLRNLLRIWRNALGTMRPGYPRKRARA